MKLTNGMYTEFNGKTNTVWHYNSLIDLWASCEQCMLLVLIYYCFHMLLITIYIYSHTIYTSGFSSWLKPTKLDDSI